MVTLFQMSKSEGMLVNVKCKDGEVVQGIVSRYIRPEDNPKERAGVIEIDKKSHYIVLKQDDIEKLEIYDPKTKVLVSTKPTTYDRFIYFMLGRDINK